MNIKELEDIMVTNGIVLRAIPEEITEIYEKRHIDKFPEGSVRYLERYHREMLVVKRIPRNAGKFIFERAPNTMAVINFRNNKFYDSIEEAMADLQKNNS